MTDALVTEAELTRQILDPVAQCLELAGARPDFAAGRSPAPPSDFAMQGARSRRQSFRG